MSTGSMTGNKRTVILATAAVALPLLAHQIVVGGIIHGVGGKKQHPDPPPLEKGLTSESNRSHQV